jgi:hypothetical protein
VNRIFFPLALLALSAVSAVLILGLYLHTKDVRNALDADAQRLATVHRLAGIAAGLCVMLVDSVVVTYFIGTSRWTKEVSETYRLDPSFVGRSNRLKRRTFPWAVLGMLTVVAITALGGAADPASSFSVRPLEQVGGAGLSWAEVHLLGALVGLAVILFGFYRMAANITANLSVINEVMAEVKRIRTQRGLE